MPKIGLQLYTIREITEKDFFGALRRVAQIGYDGVEFAGYHGAAADDLKSLLDDTGLEAAGAHIGVDVAEKDLPNQIAYASAIGCPALVVPGFWGVDYNRATFERMADLFNRAGERCRAAGLRFLYHIHGHEFVDIGGQTGMDLLFERTDPALVAFEPDTYWVEHAGVNAVEFAARYGARCPYFHLKDTRSREPFRDTEIGDGVIDIAGVIRAAPQAEWLIVEQEAFDRPHMESIQISLQNIRKMV
jgi:sugar phosphate isomerase/epimerase